MSTSPVQRLAGFVGVPSGYIECRDGSLDVLALYKTLVSLGRRPDNGETVEGVIRRHYGEDAARFARAACGRPGRKKKRNPNQGDTP